MSLENNDVALQNIVHNFFESKNNEYIEETVMKADKEINIAHSKNSGNRERA